MTRKLFRVIMLMLIGLLLVPISKASEIELTGRIIDGLGRPVPDVLISIYWLKSVSDDDVTSVELTTFRSDQRGRIRGTYDETLLPTDKGIWVDVSKSGYHGYSSTQWLSEFVLRYEFTSADLRYIASLKGHIQVRKLRELLAGHFDNTDGGLYDTIFFQEHQFRDALRELIHDPHIGSRAKQLLAFIGVPEDISFIVKQIPSLGQEMPGERWMSGVVSALLDPTTEEDWTFLQYCALNMQYDLWRGAGALTTLRLIASPRSRQILTRVTKRDAYYAYYAEEAIKYIDMNPPTLANKNLVTAGEHVAKALNIGEWEWKKNKAPDFNENGDKALLDCVFTAERHLLIHTATFHHIDGVWLLRGVRETSHVHMARAVKHGASEK